jgi:CBS domain-containing protein
MLVKEIMTKKVITIDINQTVLDAAILYQDYKVGSLIVTENDACVGMITERDIIERTICQQKDPLTTKVEEIMSKEIKTIHQLDTVEKAIDIMIENNIKKLPVIMEEHIVGIITVTDISKARPDLSKRFMETWVKTGWKD